MAPTYIALDTEATGLRAEIDEVIEIGAVRFRDGEILERWQSFIRPSQPIPYKISALTGITAQDVRHAPALHSVAPTLLRFVGDCPIVGHSIEIDLALLKRQGVYLRNRAYDTFELATLLLPSVPVYNLAGVAEALGLPVPTQHRAVADAETAMGVFEALVARLRELPLEVLSEINRATATSEWPLHSIFQEVERDAARTAFSMPISGTGSLAAIFAEAGFSQTEFDLGLIRAPETLPPFENGDGATPRRIDAEVIAASLGADGDVAGVLPNYQVRPQQVAMLGAVAHAFNEGGHLVVEAGTGTGKSVAYLLPALHFAVANKTRVVVATNTINLQEQLFDKDLPALSSTLTFRSALLKGRSNYLCLRRWAGFRRGQISSLDELRTLVKVLIWLPKTQTGDRSELLMVNNEPQVWGKLCVSEEGCPLHECVINQKGLCFFHRAKVNAEGAHVLVVNHALLLADIATGNHVLPPYNHLIVDEAHHLEDAATEQLGYHIAQAEILELADDLSRHGDGLLYGIRREFAPTLPARALAALDRLLDNLHPVCVRLGTHARELFASMQRIPEAHSEERNEYDKRLRLTQDVRKEPLWGGVVLAWDNLALLLSALAADLNSIVTMLEETDEAQGGQPANLLLELANLWHQADEIHSRLNAAILNPSDGAVYWLSSNARDGVTTIHSAPLHVGELLDRYLFSTKRTVVLTSATLSTDGDFEYVRERLGLQTAGELHVGSPFDYARSTLLYIPDDLPEPNQPGYQRQLEATLLELCVATRGRALVLFTSHSALRTTHRALQRRLEEDGLLLLGHNIDGSRRQILERFRNTPGCVLMGTSSFWEGIDVVGDALSVLVIAKLPFRVPSDPVFAARSEQFDDAFSGYSLPQAILRFKQGFGRLIRSQHDRGVVAMLDRRLVSKGYGRTFLNSLPDCTVRRGPAFSLATEAAAWLTVEAVDAARVPHFQEAPGE